MEDNASADQMLLEKPTVCKKCDCDAVGSLGNDYDKQFGQCVCREKGIHGRLCNQCEPVFWGFPAFCTCQCNDHTNICDQNSGVSTVVISLLDTIVIQDGYYGDPRLGVVIPCKTCPCSEGPIINMPTLVFSENPVTEEKDEANSLKTIRDHQQKLEELANGATVIEILICRWKEVVMLPLESVSTVFIIPRVLNVKIVLRVLRRCRIED
ncbi:hypothetical protein GCK72_026240 [Caenorhabditis remanei]|uniref:Laminin EGF-like domain-containing protein n=1 Tax=Caenorhabditis remanei TaxID=31234 RepID=A0A6A5G4W0_CAERE|nr:hypothetical protein GCK72_026240 [Caenorhabditis remanei]KAF1749771.1 hypothetical protein GCK72_026240 [Caenorhabditis remanei]